MFLNEFLNYLQSEKRYSPLTITAYKNDLEQFLLYNSEQYIVTDLSKIDHAMIRSWIVDMMDKEMSTRSVNRKIASLKSIYRYMMREGKVSINPTLKIMPPKTAKKLPVFVDQSSMEDLLDKVAFDKGYKGDRDKLIITLMYSTGIRLSELINIKLNDLNFNDSSIKILGKGNKERILPFSNELSQKLQSFVEDHNPKDWLFVTDKKKKLYPKLVYRIVNLYLSKVTTIDKKSPHVLRHTFATHMLNNGADLNAIKEFLGHTSLSATQVYTHNTIKKLSNIYKQAHPKA